METYNILQNNYRMRTYKFKGEDHLIVPLVMMVEGVHAGSQGPLLHTATELAKTVAAWNGRPITIKHPQEAGVYVSANLPAVKEREEIGMVFNAKMDGTKLKAEGWLNINKLTGKAPSLLAHVKALQPLDVSIGVFSEEDPTEGEWNGEQYKAIAINHKPDHLALLPGEQGACSWADGCGIRNNSKMEMDEVKKELVIEDVINGIIQVNTSLSFDEIFRKIQDKLNMLDVVVEDRRTVANYLQATYDDFFIYQKEDRVAGETKYYKQSYAFDASNTLTLVGEAIEVVRVLTYEPVVKQIQTNKKGGDNMTPCCKEKVNQLIANSATPWNESNREWLEAQDETIINNLAKPVEAVKPATISSEEALQVLTSGIKTTEDFLSIVPAGEMREQVQAGLALHKADKAAKIEHILNNTTDIWTKESLSALSMEMINNVAKSIKTPVDYSANGANGPVVNSGTPREVLLPTGL